MISQCNKSPQIPGSEAERRRSDPPMFPILLQQLLSSAGRAAQRRRPAGSRPLRPGRARKPINLALQGGGAHGAFTWGVLDHLLADGRLAIEGISGASAGAINAALVADGLMRGGPEQARQRLADFWRAVSVNGHLPDLQRGVVERLFSFAPQGAWLGALSRFWSPYDLNPLNINPLKELIERFVDSRRCAATARTSCSSRRPTCAPASCACSPGRRSR